MKLVRPLPVTPANLTSDVAQTETLWTAPATFGAGAAVYEIIDGIPMRFVSKAGGNSGNQPSLDTTAVHWDPQGATNRFAAFDGSIQTQTVQANIITATRQLAANEAVDTVRVGNVSALTVRVKQTDAIDGVVFDQTVDMTSDVGIDDYLPWFTEPIIRKQGLTVSGLSALYPGSQIEVTLEAPGEDAKLGLCLFGLSRHLGGTKWGGELGFRDFSVKAENEIDGGLYVVKRAFKRTASFDVIVHTGFVDELQRLLEEFRAEPVLFVGNDSFDTMAIYGFVKSFKTQVSWPTRALCTLDLESLS